MVLTPTPVSVHRSIASAMRKPSCPGSNGARCVVFALLGQIALSILVIRLISIGSERSYYAIEQGGRFRIREATLSSSAAVIANGRPGEGPGGDNMHARRSALNEGPLVDDCMGASSLDELLECRSVNNSVVLSLSTSSYVELAVNWACHWHRIQWRNTIVQAVDRRTYRMLREMGVDAFFFGYDALLTRLRTNGPWENRLLSVLNAIGDGVRVPSLDVLESGEGRLPRSRRRAGSERGGDGDRKGGYGREEEVLDEKLVGDNKEGRVEDEAQREERFLQVYYTLYKALFVERVLSKGYDVFVSDLDAVVLRDPSLFLDSGLDLQGLTQPSLSGCDQLLSDAFLFIRASTGATTLWRKAVLEYAWKSLSMRIKSDRPGPSNEELRRNGTGTRTSVSRLTGDSSAHVAGARMVLSRVLPSASSSCSTASSSPSSSSSSSSSSGSNLLLSPPRYRRSPESPPSSTPRTDQAQHNVDASGSGSVETVRRKLAAAMPLAVVAERPGLAPAKPAFAPQTTVRSLSEPRRLDSAAASSKSEKGREASTLIQNPAMAPSVGDRDNKSIAAAAYSKTSGSTSGLRTEQRPPAFVATIGAGTEPPPALPKRWRRHRALSKVITNGKWQLPKELRRKATENKEESIVSMHGVRWGRLRSNLSTSGQDFFVAEIPQQRGEWPIVVHVDHVRGAAMKRDRMVRASLWAVDRDRRTCTPLGAEMLPPPKELTEPRFRFIVLTFDRPDSLSDLLDSLAAADYTALPPDVHSDGNSDGDGDGGDHSRSPTGTNSFRSQTLSSRRRTTLSSSTAAGRRMGGGGGGGGEPEAALLNATVALDIFLDYPVATVLEDEEGETMRAWKACLRLAESFVWPYGPKRVIARQEHMGLIGQWVSVWTPDPDSAEIAVIMEDDHIVSTKFFAWLQAAVRQYFVRTYDPRLYGISMEYQHQILGRSVYGRPVSDFVPNSTVFYRGQLVSTWCPVFFPRHWDAFLKWRAEVIKDPAFLPFFSDMMTNYFHTHGQVWSSWITRFVGERGYYSLNTNFKDHRGLVVNVRARGAHFNVTKGPASPSYEGDLEPYMLNFPPIEKLPLYDFHMNLVRDHPSVLEGRANYTDIYNVDLNDGSMTE